MSVSIFIDEREARSRRIDMKVYVVRLEQQERERLERLVRAGRGFGQPRW